MKLVVDFGSVTHNTDVESPLSRLLLIFHFVEDAACQLEAIINCSYQGLKVSYLLEHFLVYLQDQLQCQHLGHSFDLQPLSCL